MSAHTPGPWQWTSDYEPVDITEFKLPGYYDNVYLTGPNNSQVVGCDTLYGRTPAERAANGRLLAAAPELFRLLNELDAVTDRVPAALQHQVRTLLSQIEGTL